MDVRSHQDINGTEVKSCPKQLTVSAATETTAAAIHWTEKDLATTDTDIFLMDVKIEIVPAQNKKADEDNYSQPQ